MRSDTNRCSRIICALPESALDAFADRLCLRDPKGLSARPALIPVTISGRPHLLVERDFVIRYEYRISPEQGERFQEITRDPNAIHKTMNVASGAMTAAKMLLPVEVLLPFVSISSARFRFRVPSFYGERTLSSIALRHHPDGRVRFEMSVVQREQVIATGALIGRIVQPGPAAEVPENLVDQQHLALVADFMQSLGVDSRFYFEREGYKDLTYPLAYLASLPSGEMVKQLEGNGGMVTSLLFDMSEQPKIPVAIKRGPHVRVRLDRIRKAFRRIVTDIIDGVITHCRGWAVVNPVAEFPFLNE